MDCVRCTANALSGGSAAPAFLATPLPLVDLGAMAAGGGGQNRGRRERNGDEQERSLGKKRKASGGFRDWDCAKGKRNSALAVTPLFMGKVRVALPIYYDVPHARRNRPTHAAHVTRTPPRRATPRAGRGKKSM